MTAPKTQLQCLAARWCAWAQVLVALARRVSMLHKQNAQGGAAEAEMIEAQIYCALVTLSGIIATYSVNERRLSRADRDALMYLRTLHALLGVMALMLRQLRTELEAAAERLAELGGAPQETTCVLTAPFPKPIPYLDSS